MKLEIRKGVREDIPEALQLVKELAIYEKAPNEVTVTVEEMERDGFGKEAVFTFYVAETEKGIVGMALYYIKYSTWKGKCVFLEDIIVTEEYRKLGIGKKLFDEVLRDAKQLNVRRLEWQVLEWNEPAIKFYEKMNAKFDSEWVNCKMTDKEIRDYKLQDNTNENI